MIFLKRLIAVFVIIAVLASTFAISAVTTDGVNNVNTSIGTNEKNSYANYSKNSSANKAKEDIVIVANEFYANNNAVVKNENINGKNMLVFKEEGGSISYKLSSKVSGKYYLHIYYNTLEGNGVDIRLGVKIDGKYPFDEAKEFSFKRCFEDAGDVRADKLGNQFAPEQVEVFTKLDAYAIDALGREAEPYLFDLSAGEHIIEIISIDEAVAIEKIVFEAPKEIPTYDDYITQYQEYDVYNGSEIVIQGENADYKSSAQLVPLADISDKSLVSSDGTLNNGIIEKINYIGSTNWQSQGDKLTWNIKAPKDGLYALSIKFRQKYVTNGVTYRKLMVDGEVPFKQAGTIGFEYDSNWDYMRFEDENNNPYLIYLSEGEHTLSLEVTLGEFSEIYRDLSSVASEMGSLYRKIVMITGETIDANRSYELFKQIPNFNETLSRLVDELNDIASRIETIQGKRGGTGISTINNAVLIMEQMVENYYTAHNYKGQFYTQYCALSSYVTELCELPLDIDYFTLSSNDYDITENKINFFEGFIYGVKRFIYSFVDDYNNVVEEKDAITIWVNWGRDQTKILNNLIQSSFTEETKIPVNLKITNATMIQGILSGNGPDLTLHMQRTAPVNYAMRGALYDLKQFDDYEEVIKRFAPTATRPYEYKDGVYALPDTQAFYLMFARTDVLDELGLEVPETWDEFITSMAIIQQNNMQVGLPVTQLTSITQVNLGLGSLSLFPTILMQMNGQVYNDERNATALDEVVALQAFEFWTKLFTEYKAPVSFDFYSRFRTGTMPLAIQGYGQYITLSVAAPEIAGKWSVYEIPGFADENGKINNAQTGGGTGAAILEETEHPEEAWEFLKWWTSAETQSAYSRNVESVLGVAGRVTSANMEAVTKLSWSDDVLEVLMASWEDVQELPELPGGYYVPRSIDMAFWNTYNKSENPKDLLLEWNEIANTEIARKIKQYEERN